MTILVETRDATEQAAEFVYAVAAALGLNIIEVTDCGDDPTAVHVQVSGNTLEAEARRWYYPDHEATFERWLVATYFPDAEQNTVWAVVQTGTDHYPLLSAAMAYAKSEAKRS